MDVVCSPDQDTIVASAKELLADERANNGVRKSLESAIEAYERLRINDGLDHDNACRVAVVTANLCGKTQKRFRRIMNDAVRRSSDLIGATS